MELFGISRSHVSSTQKGKSVKFLRPFRRSISWSEERWLLRSDYLRGDKQRSPPRVAVLGAEGVGKSCLISQFVHQRFVSNHIRTLQDMYRVECVGQQGPFNLEIVDTSGSHEFPAMKRLSITSSSAFVLVYDVTDAASFDELCRLRDQIVDLKGNAHVPIVVVGNKTDLCTSQRATIHVYTDLMVACEWGHDYVETCARDSHVVQRVFQLLLNRLGIASDVTQRLSKQERKKLRRGTHPCS